MNGSAIWLTIGLLLSGIGYVSNLFAISMGSRSLDEMRMSESVGRQPMAAVVSSDASGPRVTGTERRPQLPSPPRIRRTETAAVGPVIAATGSARSVTPQRVIAPVLRVRARPSATAAIVGKLPKGAELLVSVEGHWAKLSDNQWVLARYMTPVVR